MWELIHWVLLSIAVLLLLRGLLWDRAGFRGRAERRCRKCWSDLTGVDEDVSAGPVECAKCGKAHRTKRSMRRTRRGKRWIAAAVVVFLIGYGFRVTPEVRERGVWASVPSWVLILGIQRTPAIVQNPDLEWGSIAYGRHSSLERAMQELHVRSRVKGLSWFDYQLAAWLARTETEEMLCRNSRSRYEGVSPRAAGYCILISQGISRGKLGSLHKEWFHSLFWADVAVRPMWPEKSTVYGRIDVSHANRDTSGWNEQMWFWKTRVKSGEASFLWKHPQTVGWKVESFPDGGRRNLNIREDAGESIWALRYPLWDDGLVPLKVSRKTGHGQASVQVYRTDGLYWSPYDNEALVHDQLIEFDTKLSGTIDEYVQIVDDDELRDEIARCIETEGLYWYDMDGRWHAAFRLRLIEQPDLERRRYTFGSKVIRSISQNEELAGQAWWALNPTENGWELIHEDEFVLMHGWADESRDPGPYGYIKNLSIKSTPAFCLRDEHASVVVGGRLRLKVEWKQVQVHVN